MTDDIEFDLEDDPAQLIEPVARPEVLLDDAVEAGPAENEGTDGL